MLKIVLSFGMTFLFTLGTPVWASASAFQVDLGKNKSFPELEKFIETIESQIPETVQKRLTQKVKLDFKKIGKSSVLQVPPCFAKDAKSVQAKEQSIFGYTSRMKSKQLTVVLNEGFLAEIQKGPANSQTYDCGHKNLYQLAVATIHHEIMHYYDRNPTRAELNENKKQYSSLIDGECTLETPVNVKGSHGQHSTISEKCQRIQSQRRLLSEDHRFLEMIGWNKSSSGKHMNNLFVRSADPYELTSPEEFLATNYEFFLLDEEYQCRKPLVYNYLAQVLNVKPFAGKQCQPAMNARLQNKKREVIIDPKRIYQVHYLLAAAGEGLGSEFGHSMFRLIICSDKRTTVGPECIEDISYHIVLSYRASIGGVFIDNLKGAMGGYPAELFLMDIPEVINEYTVQESRSLVSVPIKFSEEQKNEFVLRAMDVYANYQSSYTFLTNNCASESYRLLQSVLPYNAFSLPQGFVVTPFGVYEMLKKNQLLDESVLQDKNREGRYYFSPFSKEVEAAYKGLKNLKGFPQKLKLADFFKEFRAAKRAELIETVTQLSDKEKRMQYAQKLILIEQFSDRFEKADIDRKVKEYFAEYSKNKSVEGSVQLDKKFFDQIVDFNEALKPWNQMGAGYGIPQIGQDEMSKDRAPYLRYEAAFDLIRSEFLATHPEVITERNQVNSNMDRLLSLLESL